LAWRRGRTLRQAHLPITLAVGSASLLYLASTPWVARWAVTKEWLGILEPKFARP
jgi:hypothetical protein